MTDAIALGVPVVVRFGPPEIHCRTPFYLRGKPGTVVGEFGSYRDPTLLAFHKPGLPKRRLLRVAFRQRDIWPDYAGSADDLLLADLYESWLTPAATDL
jgi:nitrile hydratase subunit beta